MKKIFFGLVLSIAGHVSAQTTAQRIDSVLTEYSERYPQEKIYLQFDRGVYNPGETIWFKAYLLAGFAPSTLSRNIYFDWYDGAGRLLKHMAAPVFEASAKGQFDIPDGYSGGALHVRAYTQWMLNFDTAFLYDKDIPVAGRRLAVGRGSREPEAARTSLGFFPEGGDLVTGLVCKVAFKANDQWGRPVAVSGVVQGSDGSFVDSLTTEHDGMGSFMIRPLPGVRYSASWTDGSGKTFSSDLPNAAPTGFAMQVQPENGRSMVIIRRTEAAGRLVYLLAHINQRVIYAAQVSLEDKPEVVVTVPTADLPTGVLQYTLFDAGWRPVAERVVFVNNQLHSFATSVRVVTSSREKRGRNELTIEVLDSAFTNLSVAVTDAGLADADEDIVSRLLLSDDIRGAVYHPAYYFSSGAGVNGTAANSGERTRQLDLVMLTHGWRRYRWADVVAGEMPGLKYPRDTNYLVLRGNVVQDRVHDLAPGEPLLLILETKDSSRKRLLVPVSPQGKFVQRGMVFYDTMRVYYDFPGNKKLSGAPSVEMGSNLLAPVGGEAPGRMETASAVPADATADTARMSRTQFFGREEAEREKKRQATMLAAVTVNGRMKRPVDVLDENYATGPFKRDAGYQFDVKDDVLALHSTDIFYYLRQVVPGLEVQYKDGYPILKWRQTTPTLFVDEVGMKPDLVADIPITDIAYVKVFHPPFLMGGVINPRAGAIAIYTKKGEDVKPLPTKGLNYKLLEGYATERQFYSPDYSVDPTGQADFLPDVRPTLYWNPYIFTDANNPTATISFYNNDVSTKLRVVVEGMNAAGKLTRTEMIIQ